jgi:protein-disulfide isomerase
MSKGTGIVGMLVALVFGYWLGTYVEKKHGEGSADTSGPSQLADQNVERFRVPLSSAPIKGSDSAQVTIVEFSDFQCPFCSRVNPTLKQVEDKYGDKVRVVFRNFPLLQIHPNAAKAAEAASCAADQGKFWEMHDKLFANQQKLAVEDLKVHATDLGLKADVFNQCLDSGQKEAEWKKDMNEGTSYGLTGTPAFFINGRLISGAQPLEAFTAIIDEELEMKGIALPKQTSSNETAPAAPAK